MRVCAGVWAGECSRALAGGGAALSGPKNFNATFKQQIPKFLQAYKHLLEKKRPRESGGGGRGDDDEVAASAKAAAMAEYERQVRWGAWKTDAVLQTPRQT